MARRPRAAPPRSRAPPSPPIPPPGVHVQPEGHRARARTGEDGPRGVRHVIAAQAAEPGMTVGMRSGSPPGKWMTSAPWSWPARPASAAVARFTTPTAVTSISRHACQRRTRRPRCRERRPGPGDRAPPPLARSQPGSTGHRRPSPAQVQQGAQKPRRPPGTPLRRGARPGRSRLAGRAAAGAIFRRRHVLQRSVSAGDGPRAGRRARSGPGRRRTAPDRR